MAKTPDANDRQTIPPAAGTGALAVGASLPTIAAPALRKRGFARPS